MIEYVTYGKDMPGAVPFTERPDGGTKERVEYCKVLWKNLVDMLWHYGLMEGVKKKIGSTMYYHKLVKYNGTCPMVDLWWMVGELVGVPMSVLVEKVESNLVTGGLHIMPDSVVPRHEDGLMINVYLWHALRRHKAPYGKYGLWPTKKNKRIDGLCRYGEYLGGSLSGAFRAIEEERRRQLERGFTDYDMMNPWLYTGKAQHRINMRNKGLE